jgi:hypothetical protein
MATEPETVSGLADIPVGTRVDAIKSKTAVGK